MFKNIDPASLTGEQEEALGKAAYLIIQAQKNAKEMLVRAGVEIPEDGFGFGSPCHAHIEGFGDCPCSDYQGDGGTCLNRITLDPGASPPHRSCGHPAWKHLST
jgi:Family of unknown function (DUF6422)